METTPSDKASLTRSQVARRLGISAELVRQLSDSGALACQLTPLGRLYDPGEVERYAAVRAATGRTTTHRAEATRATMTAGRAPA